MSARQKNRSSRQRPPPVDAGRDRAADGQVPPLPAPPAPWRNAILPVCLLLLLVGLYCLVIALIHGKGDWLYIDYVAYRNIYWGDDAYRFYLARSAWMNPDVYWFNFSLPVWTVLEGMVVSLTQADLLHARFLKAAITASSVLLLYLSCINLGISRRSAFLAALLLALMPLYVLVGMSFYGEAWLSFLVTLALFFHTRGGRRTALLVVSLMPLVRPEGIYFVMVLAAIELLNKRVLNAALPLVPGGLYFLAILGWAPDSQAFFLWRSEASRIYQAQADFYGWGGASVIDLFVLPWSLCVLAGGWWPKGRAVRGFFIASLIVLGMSLGSIAVNLAFWEPRYYAFLMPVFMLAFASFLDGPGSWQAWPWIRARQGLLAGLLATVTLFSQLSTLTTLKAALLEGARQGDPLRAVSIDPGRGGLLYGLTVQEQAGFREFAQVVTQMLRLNPDIKTLIVNNVQVFYFLDPAQIPREVRVVIPVFSRSQVSQLMGLDSALGYFARAPYFGYFRMGDPASGKNKILYLDSFPLPAYPYHWTVGGSRFAGNNDIYLFAGDLVASALK